MLTYSEQSYQRWVKRLASAEDELERWERRLARAVRQVLDARRRVKSYRAKLARAEEEAAALPVLPGTGG